MTDFPALTSESTISHSNTIHDSLYKSIASLRSNNSNLTANNDSQISFKNEDFPALGNNAPRKFTSSGQNNSILKSNINFKIDTLSREKESESESLLLESEKNVLSKKDQSDEIRSSLKDNTTSDDSNMTTLPKAGLNINSSETDSKNSTKTSPVKKIKSDKDESLDTSPKNSDGSKHIAQINHSASRYGILGLLTTNDYGFDISKFGLPLNSPGKLFSMFGSPWADIYPLSGSTEPEYILPQCYSYTLPPTVDSKINLVTEETLFYIFYSMPKDELQLVAAEELYKRQWRFHKELRIWITKDPEAQVSSRNAQGEQGVFIVFDPTIWEKVKKDIIFLPRNQMLMTNLISNSGTNQLQQQSSVSQQQQQQQQQQQMMAHQHHQAQSRQQMIQQQQQQFVNINGGRPDLISQLGVNVLGLGSGGSSGNIGMISNNNSQMINQLQPGNQMINSGSMISSNLQDDISTLNN
ncbi:putative NOT transcription complex subunit VIP2 [Smittium culicis]|uniref:Putative NOT transcription complex subunit VIP2 n=1 Tax=Smittium culicis TaxID=133412 RepID=A0A1R1XLA6_9FUNG|nr:putative NOT transcription complex subunit VIP2 [Smittium culicis]